MDDGDPFAPLSAAELATGTAPQSKDDCMDELVAPVPSEAPNPPRAHPKWGKPAACWTYRGASSAILQIVFRFDPPGARKQFLPCTLWRDAKGLRWRWKGLPTPRPLYGLEMLADNPDALVIVCEGEKSADAAQIIFPDHVAITSPGGSLAANKADWGPLAGRHVIIWPDNDEPGAKYVLELAAILTGLGCKLTVIDASALASVDAGGRGPDWTAEGWDAADALVDWSDVETLRSVALGLTKPYEAAKVAATTIAEIKSAATILNKDDIGGVKLLIEAGVVAKASRIEADRLLRRSRSPSAFQRRGWMTCGAAPNIARGSGTRPLLRICPLSARRSAGSVSVSARRFTSAVKVSPQTHVCLMRWRASSPVWASSVSAAPFRRLT